MDELQFYRGRRVLVTGHTGFKGSWLTLWLHSLGAEVSGYALPAPTVPNLFESLGLDKDVHHHLGDVRDIRDLGRVVERQRPEVVFHLAAQPLVRLSHRQPKETFDVNLGGLVNLLEVVRQAPGVRAVVHVASDKCYEPRTGPWGHREGDPLGGPDPYSASKAAGEFVVRAYRDSFLSRRDGGESPVGLASVRAGNVIGGGDWAEDRLVPDCVRALAAEEPVALRRPGAVRPWQHVLEALAGYLVLGARLAEEPTSFAEAWNFGPALESCWTVADVVDEVIRRWGSGRRTAGDRLGPDAPPEVDCLRLCSDKARSRLPWRPQWSVRTAVRHTVEWYRAYYDRQDAAALRQLALRQIEKYETRRLRASGPGAGLPRAVRVGSESRSRPGAASVNSQPRAALQTKESHHADYPLPGL